jgi:hypothetical protein
MLHKIMPQKCWIAAFVLPALILTGADQAWKTKQYPDWTEDDAKEVMTNSPWAKTVVATPVKPNGKTGQPGHRGRIAFGGLGIGRSGSGGAGRHGGDDGGKAATPDQPATLTLRWESALPMREAELKARDTGAPDVADDHYAIAVYGIPRGAVADDSKELQDELKKLAVLKREGKKDLKPSRVDILLRESGPVVVYLFSKSAEFSWRDHGIQFEAQVSRLKFSQAFTTDDMTFHGKLEL